MGDFCPCGDISQSFSGVPQCSSHVKDLLTNPPKELEPKGNPPEELPFYGGGVHPKKTTPMSELGIQIC